jgi:diguanylate cyclase (GGDEF)-like protein
MFPVAAILEEKEQLKNSLAASEARYRTLAHVDQLTGLPNRRAFDIELGNAWANACSARKELALVILDADQFKEYNDHAGHPGGDACLCLIAQTIAAAACAVNGIAARIGGEEFAVILPETTELRAREVAEQIRLRVADLALFHPASPCGVQTVSLGVAVRSPLDGQASIDLMRIADQALYSAKRSGRNQVASC